MTEAAETLAILGVGLVIGILVGMRWGKSLSQPVPTGHIDGATLVRAAKRAEIARAS
jgi:hypothetical protein